MNQVVCVRIRTKRKSALRRALQITIFYSNVMINKWLNNIHHLNNKNMNINSCCFICYHPQHKHEHGKSNSQIQSPAHSEIAYKNGS